MGKGADGVGGLSDCGQGGGADQGGFGGIALFQDVQGLQGEAVAAAKCLHAGFVQFAIIGRIVQFRQVFREHGIDPALGAGAFYEVVSEGLGG